MSPSSGVQGKYDEYNSNSNIAAVPTNRFVYTLNSIGTAAFLYELGQPVHSYLMENTVFDWRCVSMEQLNTLTTSYKEVKIGKTVYRVTSFFRVKRTWERLWSNWLSGALCRKLLYLPAAPRVPLHKHTPSSRHCRILARRWILRYDSLTGILPVEPSRRTRYGIWIVGRENKDD